MSVEPPSSGRPSEPPTEPSGRPTGPPSGPLSAGSSQPPQGPPTPPPGGDFGAGGPPPRRPWWKSAPRIALITVAVVAATALALVLTLPGGGTSDQAGEVFMQPAGEVGPDPVTKTSTTRASVPPATVAPSGSAPAGNTVPAVRGGEPGLYGGTRNVASCDVEQQIKALQQAPDKNKAFASVARVEPSGVPAYLRSLTSVQLRLDTRVTNHGYRDGGATTYQAVLQAGTAVLVDRHGVPRVRCACGNPLTPPVAQQSGYRRTGRSWPAYSPATTVTVMPSATVIKEFVLYDPDDSHHWFARRPGDDGGKDRPTRAPAHKTPSIIVAPPSSLTSPASPPCESPSTGDATGARPPGCVLPPSSGSSTEAPSSKPPSSEPPSSKPPSSESPPPEPPSSPPPSSEPPPPPSPPGSVSELSSAPGSSLSSLSSLPRSQ
ncbi:DUF6777 domain-containing protein [Streptomyces sp. NPDC054884]|uniref:DUF6777 domain-containing protein n=1 Tax=Streptomyces sp. ME08-AFT2 TaxID=3028683 RepID=UPI0029BEFBAC|nr:DUF6777 domain-containing protein [Streptomyces sp. ME08-AFT2]MDX3308802.1 hypothetical protein [Streptomyces sp. ME08-AFT2]